MLNRDSVKNRLASEAGLSFTEFSYQLFQSHDFGCLVKDYGCVAQVGGSDQWGTITAGTDYVRRTLDKVLDRPGLHDPGFPFAPSPPSPPPLHPCFPGRWC